MATPTYDQFIEPILRHLAQHPNGLPARDVYEAAAQILQISEGDRQELLPSGTQPIYKNRAGWAHDRLKRAGLSDSPRRGFWRLTGEGQAFASSHPHPLSNQELTHLATGYMDVQLRPSSKSNAELNAGHVATRSDLMPLMGSPDDQLAQALTEMRRSVTDQVLQALASVSPSFFESIVLDLLHKMGYGARREDLQRVGGSGDGGIDGVISLDKLGLEKVYVQAKRWQNSVGRPEIQAFYGALAGQRAKKGVFITTSAYTTQAQEFAKSVEGIVLVDGAKLAELMIDFELGVSTRTVKLPRIDSDYFDEDAA